MIRITRVSLLLVVILCMVMMSQFVGCGGDSDDDDNEEMLMVEAPPLPPDQSMMMDLSAFDERVPGAPASNAPVSTYKNFGNAALRVSKITAGLAAKASVPAAVFAAARAHAPVPQGDNKWLWTYSVTIEYVTFSANLTGEKNVDTTDWTMVISTDAPLRPVQDFLWYTGTSAGSNLAGSWQFYDILTPSEQNPIAEIDWSAPDPMNDVKLTIEDVDSRPENEDFGDSLKYELAGDIASISYDDVSEGEVWEIIWNIDTGEGSIRVPEYNDGEEACWNSLKQDVNCGQ